MPLEQANRVTRSCFGQCATSRPKVGWSELVLMVMVSSCSNGFALNSMADPGMVFSFNERDAAAAAWGYDSRGIGGVESDGGVVFLSFCSVLPKPACPRQVVESESTTSTLGLQIFLKINCAKRCPCSIAKDSFDELRIMM